MAKNDVYDARIDTEDDPELARIDIATGKTSRKLTIPPSWDKPYPLSINFVNLEIDENGIATFKTAAGEKYLITGIRK